MKKKNINMDAEFNMQIARHFMKEGYSCYTNAINKKTYDRWVVNHNLKPEVLGRVAQMPVADLLFIGEEAIFMDAYHSADFLYNTFYPYQEKSADNPVNQLRKELQDCCQQKNIGLWSFVFAIAGPLKSYTDNLDITQLDHVHIPTPRRKYLREIIDIGKSYENTFYSIAFHESLRNDFKKAADAVDFKYDVSDIIDGNIQIAKASYRDVRQIIIDEDALKPYTAKRAHCDNPN